MLWKGTHCSEYFWLRIVGRQVKLVIKTKERNNITFKKRTRKDDLSLLMQKISQVCLQSELINN